MRASTLATFELVSTVPTTVSPLCATGVLSDIATIRGGAFGASRMVCGATCAGAIVEASTGICVGIGVCPAFSGAGVVVGNAVATGFAVGAPAGAALVAPAAGTGADVGVVAAIDVGEDCTGTYVTGVFAGEGAVVAGAGEVWATCCGSPRWPRPNQSHAATAQARSSTARTGAMFLLLLISSGKTVLERPRVCLPKGKTLNPRRTSRAWLLPPSTRPF